MELGFLFRAEEMCLAETTTSTLKIKDLNELPSFVLKALAIFFHSCTHTMMVHAIGFFLFFHSCMLHRVHAVDFFFFAIPVRTNKPCIFVIIKQTSTLVAGRPSLGLALPRVVFDFGF
jgi:hypothetical protein